MYFFFGSPEQLDKITAISKATAASTLLFPPHWNAEMKDLLLHNQILPHYYFLGQTNSHH